jgi:DNA-binding MarR family transcriptional regulator
MSDTPKITEEPGLDDEATIARPVKQFEIVGVAALVAEMNRFLTRFATLPPFGDARIGVADWLVLIALSQHQPTIKQLSKSLGLARHRIQVIVDKLKARNFIINESSQSASKAEVIVLTAEGRQTLEGMNSALQGVFDATADKFDSGIIGRDKSFFTVSKHLKFLSRMVILPVSFEAK